MRDSFRAGALALAAAGLIGSTMAAAEDLTIVSRVTLGKGAPVTSTQYISSGKVRTSDGERDSIFDASGGRVTVIDHKKKEYFEFTRDEMAAAMRQFEQQMQSAGPLLEKMMGGKLSEVTVQKTGASRKVAGYDCDEYTVAMGDSVRYDVCAASSLHPPAQYCDALKGPYAVMGPAAQRFEKTFDEMKKIKGFPIAMNSSIKVMMVRTEMKSEATEIKKGPIPAAAFEVPAGYKKKDSPFRQKK
jgi:hypothetical protein